MTPETILFYVFALGALFSSVAVVFLRNPLMSALSLIVDFFFLAGLYILLSAHFMAVVQILVYGGAIMVLFMFIIMLLNLRDHELEKVKVTHFHQILAVAAAAAMCGLFAFQISTMFDHGAIKKGLDQNTEKIAQNPNRVQSPIPSKVPGLNAVISEQALNLAYRKKLDQIEHHDYSNLDAKYPRDQKTQPELPPILKVGQGLDLPKGAVLPTKITFGTAETLSVLLVNRFVIPFELTAILLLAAIVGAVIIAKKRL